VLSDRPVEWTSSDTTILVVEPVEGSSPTPAGMGSSGRRASRTWPCPYPCVRMAYSARAALRRSVTRTAGRDPILEVGCWPPDPGHSTSPRVCDAGAGAFPIPPAGARCSLVSLTPGP
jgi:hypothetical protein